MRQSNSLPAITLARSGSGSAASQASRDHGRRLPSLTSSASGFDAAKHSWQTPQGQAYQREHLLNEHSPQSYAWILQKSKNHTGYGVDGRVNPGEVQGTAVSGDSPNWFCGPRTFEGPFSTKTVPVRRCPDVEVNPNGKLTYIGKEFIRGPNLSISEIHREMGSGKFRERISIGGTDSSRSQVGVLPSKAPVPAWLQRANHNKAKDCHLYGGCISTVPCIALG
ncbi:unnamed protein product [Polarella glacialis]|uniref:Uncharacterized protein n=1 Tax=Polarella glacialis TaxID=89957 RepID=A0A813L1S4_POLGL|nr:unnamed protein product [Polarella glacialis]CAE8611661.1 unnamed protein product [Polarella glacialis]CAE8718070.1 unnamed protein product [Polarella glacialis]|mmetsp:Transcript_50081/g.81169  ORF Transcript_50081/g.81169 Transcript_50081/m.81169 type:complete len:223 (-) Transcript_50081:176-844(-)